MSKKPNQSSEKVNYWNSDNPWEFVFAPLLEAYDKKQAEKAKRAAERAERAAEEEERAAKKAKKEAQEATKNQSTTTATQNAENGEPEALLSEDDVSAYQGSKINGNHRNNTAKGGNSPRRGSTEPAGNVGLNGPFAEAFSFRELPKDWMNIVGLLHCLRSSEETLKDMWTRFALNPEARFVGTQDTPPVLRELVPLFIIIATSKITVAMIWQVRFIHEKSAWHKESGDENLKSLIWDVFRVAETWAKVIAAMKETEEETE